MPARKRTTSRSRLNRAVRAGRSALAQAQRRVPPDLRRQIDKSIKDGQRRFDSTVKDIRTRVNQAAKQADLNKALKRLDGLSKQVQQLARKVTSGSTRAARSTRSRATSTRRAVTRKAAARKPARRKPAARKTAASKPRTTAASKPAAARRASTRRTPAATRQPTIRYVPPAVTEAPGPMPIRSGGARPAARRWRALATAFRSTAPRRGRS